MTDVVFAPDRTVVAERREIRTVRAVEQSIAVSAQTASRSVLVRPEVPALALLYPRMAPLSIVAAGLQGPPGIPGTGGAGGEAVPYDERRDWISETQFYFGEAEPGSAENAPVWRIYRKTVSAIDDDSVKVWANGSAAFDKRWDQRASLTYAA